jgi:WD40 repeat protein
MCDASRKRAELPFREGAMRILDRKKKRAFHSIAFDPTGQFLAAGAGHDVTHLWDVVTGTRRSAFAFPSVRLPLQAVHFHPHSARLLLPTGGGLCAHDPNTGQLTATFVKGSGVGPVTVDPTDDWAVCSHHFGTHWLLAAVRRLGEPDQEVLWRALCAERKDGTGYAVHLSCLPDGARFVSAELLSGPSFGISSGRVAIRSRTDGRLLHSSGAIFTYGDRVFGSHASDVVVVQSSAVLRIHPINDLTAPPRIIRNDNRKHFTGIAFHPSGKYLAVTSNDATVKLYDMTTWEVARTFTWDIGKMRSICFSPDGTLAAAGSDRGKIVVWDVDL